MRYLIFVAIFIIGSQEADHAQVLNTNKLDGNELLKDCRAALQVLDSGKTQNSAGANKCFGYLKGFTDGTVMLAAANPNARWSFICPATEVTVNQQVRIVTKYLAEHSDQLYKSADQLVSSALVHAFPCLAKD
jgi:hypothetical protein